MQLSSTSINIRYSAHFLWGSQKQLYLRDMKLAKTRGNFSLSGFAKEQWSLLTHPLGGACGSFTVSCTTEIGSRNEVIMIFELNTSSTGDLVPLEALPGKQPFQGASSLSIREHRSGVSPQGKGQPHQPGTDLSSSRDTTAPGTCRQQWGGRDRSSSSPAGPR